MFRKRRRPTPGFKIPSPFNPMQGGQANLRQDGTSPYCAMMQIAAEDTYDDYVICRGFDTRILRFVDYAEGDPNKPGISVAKPFGKRRAGEYQIAEVYPALLPVQGNDVYAGFRQGVFTPPSPTAVHWRVGQNPGVVTGGLDGGQPDDLSDTIGILRDHNEKAVNWLLIDAAGGGAANFFVYELTADPTLGSPTTGFANIYSAEDESTLIASAAPWIANKTIFDDQVAGDGGTCIEVAGTYYAVNAIGCDSGSGGSPGIHIGPTAPSDTSLLWIDTSGL